MRIQMRKGGVLKPRTSGIWTRLLADQVEGVISPGQPTWHWGMNAGGRGSRSLNPTTIAA